MIKSDVLTKAAIATGIIGSLVPLDAPDVEASMSKFDLMRNKLLESLTPGSVVSRKELNKIAKELGITSKGFLGKFIERNIGTTLSVPFKKQGLQHYIFAPSRDELVNSLVGSVNDIHDDLVSNYLRTLYIFNKKPTTDELINLAKERFIPVPSLETFNEALSKRLKNLFKDAYDGLAKDLSETGASSYEDFITAFELKNASHLHVPRNFGNDWNNFVWDVFGYPLHRHRVIKTGKLTGQAIEFLAMRFGNDQNILYSLLDDVLKDTLKPLDAQFLNKVLTNKPIDEIRSLGGTERLIPEAIDNLFKVTGIKLEPDLGFVDKLMMETNVKAITPYLVNLKAYPSLAEFLSRRLNKDISTKELLLMSYFDRVDLIKEAIALKTRPEFESLPLLKPPRTIKDPSKEQVVYRASYVSIDPSRRLGGEYSYRESNTTYLRVLVSNEERELIKSVDPNLLITHSHPMSDPDFATVGWFKVIDDPVNNARWIEEIQSDILGNIKKNITKIRDDYHFDVKEGKLEVVNKLTGEIKEFDLPKAIRNESVSSPQIQSFIGEKLVEIDENVKKLKSLEKRYSKWAEYGLEEVLRKAKEDGVSIVRVYLPETVVDLWKGHLGMGKAIPLYRDLPKKFGFEFQDVEEMKYLGKKTIPSSWKIPSFIILAATSPWWMAPFVGDAEAGVKDEMKKLIEQGYLQLFHSSPSDAVRSIMRNGFKLNGLHTELFKPHGVYAGRNIYDLPGLVTGREPEILDRPVEMLKQHLRESSSPRSIIRLFVRPEKLWVVEEQELKELFMDFAESRFSKIRKIKQHPDVGIDAYWFGDLDGPIFLESHKPLDVALDDVINGSINIQRAFRSLTGTPTYFNYPLGVAELKNKWTNEIKNLGFDALHVINMAVPMGYDEYILLNPQSIRLFWKGKTWPSKMLPFLLALGGVIAPMFDIEEAFAISKPDLRQMLKSVVPKQFSNVEVKKAILKLPEQALEGVKEIRPKSSLTPETKGLLASPEEIRSVLDERNTEGLAIPTKKDPSEVVIFLDEALSPPTIFHEIGHAVWAKLQPTLKQVVETAVRLDPEARSRIRAMEMRTRTHLPDIEEVFSETFAAKSMDMSDLFDISPEPVKTAINSLFKTWIEDLKLNKALQEFKIPTWMKVLGFAGMSTFFYPEDESYAMPIGKIVKAGTKKAEQLGKKLDSSATYALKGYTFQSGPFEGLTIKSVRKNIKSHTDWRWIELDTGEFIPVTKDFITALCAGVGMRRSIEEFYSIPPRFRRLHASTSLLHRLDRTRYDPLDLQTKNLELYESLLEEIDPSLLVERVWVKYPAYDQNAAILQMPKIFAEKLVGKVTIIGPAGKTKGEQEWIQKLKSGTNK